MESSLPALALPSAIVLILLVFHSLRVLPLRRASWFWASVCAYGILRGLGVRWVMERLHARAPYVLHDPRFSLLGVSAQEIAGWAIVSYLAWWLADRFCAARSGSRLLPQVAWACLFLGATSWAVESTAVAAGWWHWTVPASGGLLGEVPAIGIVDWFFVGTDFLLPFLVWTAPSHLPRGWRLLSLAAFPLHFGAHLIPGRPDLLPIPWIHLGHWALLGTLLWLALRSTAADRAFAGETSALRTLPLLSIGVILLDLSAVQVFGLARPELAFTLLPLGLVALTSLRPVLGPLASGAAALLGLLFPQLFPSVLPGATAIVLGKPRSSSRRSALGALGLLALVAYGTHARIARREEALQAGLDAALSTRDRGDLEGAARELARLTREFPTYHAPYALLGEIDYRMGRSTDARAAFRSTIRIQPSYVRGYRYLGVLDLLEGNRERAVTEIQAGLRVEPGDLELRYLRLRAGAEREEDFWRQALEAGPAAVENLALLAYEVGDAAGASRAVDEALTRWPDRASLVRMRERLQTTSDHSR